MIKVLLQVGIQIVQVLAEINLGFVALVDGRLFAARFVAGDVCPITDKAEALILGQSMKATEL